MSSDPIHGLDLDGIVDGGAAGDSAHGESELMKLPRVMRYSALALHLDVAARLVADLVQIAADLGPAAATWSEGRDPLTWKGFAKVLDARAATEDHPVFRGFADSVRLLSLRMPLGAEDRADATRVALALHACLVESRRAAPLVDFTSKTRALCEHLAIGWTAIACGVRQAKSAFVSSANSYAHSIGRDLTFGVRMEAQARAAHTEEARERQNPPADAAHPIDVPTVPEGHVLVCQVPPEALKDPRTKAVVRGHEHAINTPLALRPVPDLRIVRERLVFEFPYAEAVIEWLLAPLIARTTITMPPALLCGAPGSGKSRVVRRLAELLDVRMWRTDGSQADGAVFGGTERRWHSAEPCHGFLAVSRYRLANPLILIDELDKSATRSDYGRLWDSLLTFLEPETAKSYLDPALQVPVDLSHLSYIATANFTAPIPGPLLDRFRIMDFPEPRASDLDRLIPPVLVDLASDRGVDARWIEPLTRSELDLVAVRWAGGSVRRLRRLLDVILRARERAASRH